MSSRIILFFIFLISTSQLKAESLVYLGIGPRFDLASNGNDFERYYPLRIGGGYFFKPTFYLGGDISYYTYGSNSGSVEVSTQHYEFMLWARASAWPQPSWRPYIMAGLGLQKVVVTTSFMGDSSRDEGRFEFVPALGAGVFNQITGVLAAGFELRGMYRPKGSPRTTIEGIFSIGCVF